MKKAAIILNHQPVKEMVEELTKTGHEIVEMPQELKSLWGNVPATTDWHELKRHLEPLLKWLIQNEFDSVIIAGEPSAIYYLILNAGSDFATRCFVPVSERISVDEVQPDGTVKKVSVFKYKGLRPYYVNIYR